MLFWEQLRIPRNQDGDSYQNPTFKGVVRIENGKIITFIGTGGGSDGILWTDPPVHFTSDDPDSRNLLWFKNQALPNRVVVMRIAPSGNRAIVRMIAYDENNDPVSQNEFKIKWPYSSKAKISF